MTSSRRHSAKLLSTTIIIGDSIIVLVTDLWSHLNHNFRWSDRVPWVLLIQIKAGQGSVVPEVDAGGGCWDFFLACYRAFLFSSFLGDSSI